MYTDFYGLREKPFQLSPDPRFLFLAESHREALAHLLYGVEQGEGFIAVTGEVGTGKTTLCRALLRRLDPSAEVAIIFNPQLSARELLEAIHLELALEIPGPSRRELMDRLNRFLLEKKEQGRRVLLIIDEAQTLGPDALEQIRLLSNLETESSKLIQIILLGQPEFDTMLESPSLRQLRQRISVRWRLSPLTTSETAAYVRHRLRIAAGAARELFTEAALREVHRRSGGIPRLVNLICDRSLLAGYGAGATSIGLPLVVQADQELRGGRGAPPLAPAPRAKRSRDLVRLAPAAALVLVGVLLVLLWQVVSPTRLEQAPASASKAAPTPAAAIAPARAEQRSELPASEPAPTPRPAAAVREQVPVLPPTPAESLPDPAPVPPARPPEVATAADLDRRLAAVDPRSTIAAGLDAALVAWGLPPVGARSLSLVAAIAEIRARDFVLLPVNEIDSGSLAKLGHLAFVSLRSPDGEARSVLLRSVREDAVEVVGLGDAGTSTILPRAAFDDRVVGEAWVIWRDFEALPVILRRGDRGSGVEWMQRALQTLGFMETSPNGIFDQATLGAVTAFQARRGLRVDGEVGPRTKMALYAELGSYELPLLDREGDG